MPFYTDKQREDFKKGFFKWVDGTKVKLKVKNVSQERFSDGKNELLLDITNVDTGQKWDAVKYQFDFANKLDDCEGYVDENTVLEVQPKVVGQVPNKKDPTQPYDKFDFIITVVGQDAPATAPSTTDAPPF